MFHKLPICVQHRFRNSADGNLQRIEWDPDTTDVLDRILDKGIHIEPADRVALISDAQPTKLRKVA